MAEEGAEAWRNREGVGLEVGCSSQVVVAAVSFPEEAVGVEGTVCLRIKAYL